MATTESRQRKEEAIGLFNNVAQLARGNADKLTQEYLDKAIARFGELMQPQRRSKGADGKGAT